MSSAKHASDRWLGLSAYLNGYIRSYIALPLRLSPNPS